MKVTGLAGLPTIGKGDTAAAPHISQLSATKRAIADQSIRDALLAIIAAQGKEVTIPISHLNAISEQYRLVVEVQADQVVLRAEKAEPIIKSKST